MDAILVVDMQVRLLNGEPKHDLRGVIERINRLAVSIIRHHHWVWSDLITQRSIRLASTNELLL
jgi:nicotinamidase-related amidase